ncbi:hypothetical protein FM105_01230 [Brevibacterium yomogidense]|uniref:Uncharacterized protein n=1 Tax=Brevibacterium yomogidense TaxID=946573 RepID=A0A1X6WV58_9MICO|nr:hypothetical protein FM105_01230 [Brevibacterium yomogidense]
MGVRPGDRRHRRCPPCLEAVAVTPVSAHAIGKRSERNSMR